MDTIGSFEDSLELWITEAHQVEMMETLDIWIAFDKRDWVERELASGYYLSDDGRAKLDEADRLFADEAESIIEVFDCSGTWYDSLPDDHYARRFAKEHGASEDLLRRKAP